MSVKIYPESGTRCAKRLTMDVVVKTDIEPHPNSNIKVYMSMDGKTIEGGYCGSAVYAITQKEQSFTFNFVSIATMEVYEAAIAIATIYKNADEVYAETTCIYPVVDTVGGNYIINPAPGTIVNISGITRFELAAVGGVYKVEFSKYYRWWNVDGSQIADEVFLRKTLNGTSRVVYELRLADYCEWESAAEAKDFYYTQTGDFIWRDSDGRNRDSDDQLRVSVNGGESTMLYDFRRRHDDIDEFANEIEVGSPVKAVHITELREIVGRLREFYALPAYPFSTIVAGSTSLGGWLTHVNELRSAIDDIAVELGETHEKWIAIERNQPRADVMNQIRRVLIAL